MSNQTNYTTNINCAEFCNYNKKLFCPFFKEVNFPKPEEKPSNENEEKIPDEIKEKKKSVKPKSKKKFKIDDNKDDNDKYVDEFMQFDVEISLNNLIIASVKGRMYDLNSGAFEGNYIFSNEDEENDNIEEKTCDGFIHTNNKECDFGGELELKLNNFNEKNTLKLTGKFQSNYEGGGFPVIPEDNENNSDNKNETNEELTKKQYAGTCDFGSFNGTITIYTNM